MCGPDIDNWSLSDHRLINLSPSDDQRHQSIDLNFALMGMIVIIFKVNIWLINLRTLLNSSIIQ